MADGSVVIGVQLDTAAFAASAVRLENQIMSLGTRLNTALTSSLAGAGVGDGMTGAFMGITNAASSMAQNLSSIIRTAASEAVSGFIGAGWTEAGSTAASSLTEGFRSGSSGMVSAVRDTAETARAAFDTGTWSGIGYNMMSGVAEGVRAAGAEVVAAIRAVSRQTENAVKDHFKINSPSVLMRDEVGVMLSRGIAEGITGGTSFIGSAVDSLYRGTKEKLIPGGGGSVTQNIYLRDSDTSHYQTAKRIKRESEAAMRL